MPALLYMGRRWGIGSDELAVPSLCSMALRVVWSVALVVTLFEVGGDLRGCSDGWLVYSYLLCSLSTFALSVVVELGITRVSVRGSIADTVPRESMSGYISVHMLLGLVQLGMAALGIALMTYFDSTCEGVLTDEALNILLLVVTASQILDVAVTCCCCALMRGNPEDGYRGGGGGDGFYERFPSRELEGQWESRCHWLYRVLVFVTCGLFGGCNSAGQTDFERLARVMARIFHTEEYLDVVPSDIAAGIVLLYHKQRHQRHAAARLERRSSPSSTTVRGVQERVAQWNRDTGEEERGERTSLTTLNDLGDSINIPLGMRARSVEHKLFYKVLRRKLLDVSNPVDRKALEEVSHYSRYSLAIYTWYLYVFERPCCGACELLCYSCTGRSRAFHKSRGSSKWTTGAFDVESPRGSESEDLEQGERLSSTGGQGGRFHHRSGRSSAADSSDATGAGNGTTNGTANGSNSNGRGYNAGHGDGVVTQLGEVSVRGDNWLGTHEAGLLRVAGLHSGCEVVDAQFANGIKVTPYCVLVDHDWRCVVVSIRGTMSLDDCVCDLEAVPASMAEAGRKWGFDGSDMVAHKGVLGRAEWVRQDLEDQGHLASLLGPRELSNSARRHRCRGYSLRITGHSLGGSTGVLLTYMLRSTYPSTRCISISPLGGLLNAPFADDCKEFVLSAALGEDVVPRLSVTAMERMRDSVLELIARSKVNKLKVMRSMVRHTTWRGRGRRFSASSTRNDSAGDNGSGDDLGGLVYPPSQPVPDTPFSRQLERYRECVDERGQDAPFPELLTAGRFVHFIKTGAERRCCGSSWKYTPVWAEPKDFSDIKVSKRMFLDHLPNRSCPRFQDTFKMLMAEAEDASALVGGGRPDTPGAMGVTLESPDSLL